MSGIAGLDPRGLIFYMTVILRYIVIHSKKMLRNYLMKDKINGHIKQINLRKK